MSGIERFENERIIKDMEVQRRQQMLLEAQAQAQQQQLALQMTM